MNKTTFIFAVAALALTACHGGHHEGHEGHDHDPDEEIEAYEGHDDHEEHDDHDGMVVLKADMAERFGVTSEQLTSAPMPESLRCSAVIERAAGSQGVASAPVAGTVHYAVTAGAVVGRGAVVATVTAGVVSGGDANAAARAALNAAEAEVARLKPLFDEQLVTAAEYRAAEATLAQARAAYSPAASSGRAVSPIAGTITSLTAAEGAYVEAGAPLATITADGNLTLTARTAAENYSMLQRVTDARIITPSGQTVLLSAMHGHKGGVSAEGGYATLTFNLINDGTLAPGSSVEVWLLGSARTEGLSVPRSAIVEQQGQFFVYKEVMPEHYQKAAVTIGPGDGERVQLLSGVEAGERVVTRGATTVRLAEASGSVPEGHNHNH